MNAPARRWLAVAAAAAAAAGLLDVLWHDYREHARLAATAAPLALKCGRDPEELALHPGQCADALALHASWPLVRALAELCSGHRLYAGLLGALAWLLAPLLALLDSWLVRLALWPLLTGAAWWGVAPTLAALAGAARAAFRAAAPPAAFRADYGRVAKSE